MSSDALDRARELAADASGGEYIRAVLAALVTENEALQAESALFERSLTEHEVMLGEAEALVARLTTSLRELLDGAK